MLAIPLLAVATPLAIRATGTSAAAAPAPVQTTYTVDSGYGTAATAFVYKPGCVTRAEYDAVTRNMTDRRVIDIFKATALSLLEGTTTDGAPYGILYWPKCGRVGEASTVYIYDGSAWRVAYKSWDNRVN